MNDAPAPARWMDNPEDIVLEGVDRFAKAELKLRQAQKAILEIIPVIEAGNAAAMMGNLQTQRMIADLKVCAGDAAHAESGIWRLHAEGTKIAEDNGVDPPHTEGGGPR